MRELGGCLRVLVVHKLMVGRFYFSRKEEQKDKVKLKR